jgi:hypothetical protein
MRITKAGLWTSIAVAVLIAADIFLFAPAAIYRGNIEEFSASLPAILSLFLAPAGVLLLAVIAIALALPDNWHQRFVALLGGLAILLWLQSNLLIWRYGVIDGTSIDWSRYHLRGLADLTVWGAVIALVLIRYRSFYRRAAMISTSIILLQSAMLGISSYQNPRIWAQSQPIENAPPAQIFEFSTRQNVLHITLDQFGTTLFDDILRKDDRYRDELEGFTFFREALASIPVTYLSVPSFLSGRSYQNRMTVEQFHDRYYDKNNIQVALASNHGYDLDVIAHSWFIGKRHCDSNFYQIPTPYDASARYSVASKAALLLDIALFRSAPHFLKRYIYNNQTWLFSSLILPEQASRFEHYSGNEFILDLTRHAFVGRQRPVYKYIHVNTPHPPLVVDENCRFAGGVLPVTRENFTRQARCSLDNVLRLFDRLKSLGLYDSTLVILQSDHGSGIPFGMDIGDGTLVDSTNTPLELSDSFMPLLLIKPPYGSGPMKTSAVQCELSDIPATISALLHLGESFPGESVFDLGPKAVPTRKAYYSSATDRDDAMISGHFDDLQEYVCSGSVFKMGSWSKGRLLERVLEPYAWGDVMRFREGGNILPYLVKGWSLPEREIIWNNGKTASVRFPIGHPKGDAIEMTARISPFLVPESNVRKQRVRISINGVGVGEWNLTAEGMQDRSLSFPTPVLDDSAEMEVTFAFPDAIVPVRRGIGRDERMLGAAFDFISFQDGHSRGRQPAR